MHITTVQPLNYSVYLYQDKGKANKKTTFPISNSTLIPHHHGTFDFVDETDYLITRKTDYVPIPHTDGAGMVLPSISVKNFMFRAPWIKGLLGVFDFRRFIEINNCSPVVKDIYGVEHNVIKPELFTTRCSTI